MLRWSLRTKKDFDVRSEPLLSASPDFGSTVHEASDAAYYLVGAITNRCAVSSNAYFNNDTLLRLGFYSDGALPSVTGDLYDPNAFAAFLIYSGAINDLDDIDALSYRDLANLKKEEAYRSFIRLYEDFYREAKKLG